MGGLLGKSKSSSGGEEVWRQDSQFENRLAHQHYPDTWGGVTSYNLLDIQDIKHVSSPPAVSQCPFLLDIVFLYPFKSLHRAVALTEYWNFVYFQCRGKRISCKISIRQRKGRQGVLITSQYSV